MSHLILLIDDDEALAEAVKRILARTGHQVAFAASARAARETLAQCQPDLVVLDLILPDADGMALCREIRCESQVPIVILSCRTEHADRVAGLEAGADDYVTKPFSLSELVCRIHAVLRRAGTDDSLPPGIVRAGHGKVAFHTAEGVAEVAGRSLALTPSECSVMRELARRIGEVVSREELAQAAGRPGERDSRAVVDHIGAIRRKLEQAGAPGVIQTVRGFGYRLE